MLDEVGEDSPVPESILVQFLELLGRVSGHAATSSVSAGQHVGHGLEPLIVSCWARARCGRGAEGRWGLGHVLESAFEPKACHQRNSTVTSLARSCLWGQCWDRRARAMRCYPRVLMCDESAC